MCVRLLHKHNNTQTQTWVVGHTAPPRQRRRRRQCASPKTILACRVVIFPTKTRTIANYDRHRAARIHVAHGHAPCVRILLSPFDTIHPRFCRYIHSIEPWPFQNVTAKTSPRFGNLVVGFVAKESIQHDNEHCIYSFAPCVCVCVCAHNSQPATKRNQQTHSLRRHYTTLHAQQHTHTNKS